MPWGLARALGSVSGMQGGKSASKGASLPVWTEPPVRALRALTLHESRGSQAAQVSHSMKSPEVEGGTAEHVGHTLLLKART